ncbi:selenium cofactor biosynthesis protein YqeC [Pleomorphochaeta sp. DL1XJH-081]|uniref:selenium cofactor biosynthesis protein YqeC n=1 Tax=Pleomorphochaeta sp. DL1XJH-081 TaxID=3409690 RepID=UPI003BB7CF74
MAIVAVEPNPIACMLDACIARHCPQDGPWIVSVTGSGGKTTTIEQLSRYWAGQGKRVLVTTTTKMAHPDRHHYPFDHYHLVKKGDNRSITSRSGAVTLYGVDEYPKITSVEEQSLHRTIRDFDRILIEADGARGLPLKMHAQRDPVILANTHVVLALVGLGAIDSKLDEQVMYLSDRYRQLTKDSSETVSEKTYRILADHPEGILKGCSHIPVLICFNQCDTIKEDRARNIVNTMNGNGEDHTFSMTVFSWHEGTILYDGSKVDLEDPERRIG